jgi:hypothetical protein
MVLSPSFHHTLLHAHVRLQKSAQHPLTKVCGDAGKPELYFEFTADELFQTAMPGI